MNNVTLELFLENIIKSKEFIILLTVFVTWFSVQFYKKITITSATKSFFVSGGMPSSHTATSVSLAVLLFLYQGLTTTTILALFLVSVLIRDAIGVRQAVGRNAEVLKNISSKQEQKNIMLEHGHTIPQVIVGVMVGVVFASISYALFIL